MTHPSDTATNDEREVLARIVADYLETTDRFIVIERGGAFDLVDTVRGMRHSFSNKAVAEGHAGDFNRYPREAEALAWETHTNEARMRDAIEATDNDLKLAIHAAEAMAGMSHFELARCAETDDFPDLKSRAAWYAIANLRDLATKGEK